MGGESLPHPFLQHLTSPVGVKSSSLYSSTIPRRGGKGISNPRSVSRRVGKRDSPPTWWGDFQPRSVSRRVGKGFPTHGGADFPRRVGKGPTGCVKKGGIPQGILPHPRVKKGGIPQGISHPRGVSRRVGKGFPTHGGFCGFPAHGKKGYLRMTILRVAE